MLIEGALSKSRLLDNAATALQGTSLQLSAPQLQDGVRRPGPNPGGTITCRFLGARLNLDANIVIQYMAKTRPSQL